MISEYKPRTGDVVLFSSNTSTAMAIRTLTSSIWNHVGIAVLFKPDGTISLDDTGKLYILEINTWERKDAITGDKCIGAAYSEYAWVKRRYNVVAVRKLKERYRIPKLIDHIHAFIDRYRGYKFTSSLSSFLSVIINVPLNGTIKKIHDSKGEMLCSELSAYFYVECIGPLLPEVDGVAFHGSLCELMGDDGPKFPVLCMPEHFSYLSTPNARILHRDDIVIYHKEADCGVVLIPIVIITIFVVIILCMILSSVNNSSHINYEIKHGQRYSFPYS